MPCVRRHPLQTLSQTAQARKRPTSVSTHHPQEELEELVKHLPGHRVVSKTGMADSQPRSRWREVAGDGAGASAAVRRALHALLRDDFQAHCVRLTQSMLRFDHST